MEKNDKDNNIIYDEDILNKLIEYNIFVKGASKAFTIFLILWFLSKRNMHGYLIMKKIDEFFMPQIEVGLMKETKANKIYPLLKTLTEHKLIEFYPGIHKKKDVKIYRLTEEGEKTLKLIKTAYRQNTQRKIWKELINDLIKE
ncbi:PadR family transcriptional regulator [Methanosphaera sp. ISO3-F5]|uniref:PadR family transcriptional regulator n=1 Tax=Methanosphaera sp. ISO3-F5 TaxID=1452353 RepID=UPI002B257CED|nr:PadR family transcriptional regulator [Methanosphaera sp. ISO3-F5]WQH63507.1 PadR family transcriptional regulator [Methanosphaera sp. ISO3-F5]